MKAKDYTHVLALEDIYFVNNLVSTEKGAKGISARELKKQLNQRIKARSDQLDLDLDSKRIDSISNSLASTTTKINALNAQIEKLIADLAKEYRK
jgi:hypothetical protein